MIHATNFKKWNIQNAVDIEPVLNELRNLPEAYLLNFENESALPLEMIARKLARFQIEQLDDYENREFYVEFSNECRNKIQDEHCKEDTSRINPLICSYTFFNNSSIPLFITNIDFEKYKYKQFTDENDFIMAFPNKLDHVSFNGNLYHGFKPVFNKDTESPIALKINIYDKKPSKLEYYMSSDAHTNVSDYEFAFKSDLYHGEFITDTTHINRKFMENMLYEKTSILVDFTEMFLRNEDNIRFATNHLRLKPQEDFLKLPVEVTMFEFNFLFVLKSQKQPFMQTKYFLSLIEKYGYVMYDILDCYKQNIMKTNRLHKECKYEHFYSEQVCEWIVNEMKLVDSKASKFNVEKVPHLFRFVIGGIKPMMDFVTKSYHLTNMTMNLTNLQIIKESKDYVHEYDNSHIFTMRIPLSNTVVNKQDIETKHTSLGDMIISNMVSSDENDKIEGGERITLICNLDFVYE
jgi:hypothetical protein